MNALRQILMFAAIVTISVSPLAAGRTIQEIEQLPFDEAYHLWLQEQKAVAKNLEGFPIGITEPKTGVFTPATIWVLSCRLGREAHLRESFLVSALATNEWVCEILESSPKLCERYGIESQAPVRFDPEGGYKSVPRSWMDGLDLRRENWLKAIKKTRSQPGQ